MELARAFVFDLDGTLVDSARAICDAAASALVELGARVSAADIEPHLGAPLSELYDEFIGSSDQSRYPRFVERYIAIHDEHPARHPLPLPGVVAGLSALVGRGLPLAVATTKPSDRASAQIHSSGLGSSFAHIQGTDLGMRAKPHPDVIERACAGLGVAPTEVVMVGDTVRDVRAAKAIGAYAVAIAYSDLHLERALSFGADLVVRSVEELRDFSL